MGRKEDDEDDNKRFNQIKSMFKSEPEEEDNSPASDNEKILASDLNKKIKDNEVPIKYTPFNRSQTDNISSQGGEVNGNYNTQKLIKKGKIGSGDALRILRKIKSNSVI